MPYCEASEEQFWDRILEQQRRQQTGFQKRLNQNFEGFPAHPPVVAADMISVPPEGIDPYATSQKISGNST
jgi:hypothetical protein